MGVEVRLGLAAAIVLNMGFMRWVGLGRVVMLCICLSGERRTGLIAWREGTWEDVVVVVGAGLRSCVSLIVGASVGMACVIRAVVERVPFFLHAFTITICIRAVCLVDQFSCGTT